MIIFFPWLKRNVLVLLCLALVILLWFKELQYERLIKEDLDNLDWRMAVASYDRGDVISTEVGVIQFLKRGYSIAFDSAQYIQDGLVLTGRVGNPTNLLISTLTLDFTARCPIYTAREKYLRSKMRFLYALYKNFEPDIIGKAQVSVGILGPGSTAGFRVTIPNVKQTSEATELLVSFSGERYSYTC